MSDNDWVDAYLSVYGTSMWWRAPQARARACNTHGTLLGTHLTPPCSAHLYHSRIPDNASTGLTCTPRGGGWCRGLEGGNAPRPSSDLCILHHRSPQGPRSRSASSPLCVAHEGRPSPPRCLVSPFLPARSRRVQRMPSAWPNSPPALDCTATCLFVGRLQCCASPAASLA